MSKKLLILLCILIILIFSGGCFPEIAPSGISDSETPPVQVAEADEPPADIAPEDRTLRIAAVGDIMMHDSMIQAGRQPSGGYDFSSFFAAAAPYLKEADLLIGNLETPLAGAHFGYSGYPRFNTPEILAENLGAAGFDVLLTANNHCMDQGYTGLINTLDVLDAAGLAHTGTFRSQEERDQILMFSIKGVHIAVLAYTYGSNGLLPPKGKSFSVNFIDTQTILSDIKRAHYVDKAELIIVGLHFGTEYELDPNKDQQQLVQQIFAAGADIVLGSHPHVLQPMSSENDRFVIYSLGNFISDQRGIERLSSVILQLSYSLETAGEKPVLEDIGLVPIRTRRFKYNGMNSFEVLPILPALEDASAGSSIYSEEELAALKESLDFIDQQLGGD